MECYFCRSSDLRLSHFRLFDLRPLLSLKIPVRCRSCRERDYVKLSEVRPLIFSGKASRHRKNGGRTGVESAR